MQFKKKKRIIELNVPWDPGQDLDFEQFEVDGRVNGWFRTGLNGPLNEAQPLLPSEPSL